MGRGGDEKVVFGQEQFCAGQERGKGAEEGRGEGLLEVGDEGRQVGRLVGHRGWDDDEGGVRVRWWC